MSNEASSLGWHRINGSARDIGLALGRQGRDAVHRHLTGSAIWRMVTGPRHAASVTRMVAATRARFPAIAEELAGLAEGLELPFEAVMAWNCRGDLVASAPDGCTTVILPGNPAIVAHNEDGLPFFRGACFIAEIAPQSGRGFRAFCYPGSLPGHAFALNDAGFVQTVNNLRLNGVPAQIPRMVLSRAMLEAASPEAALALLGGAPESGGFHITLAGPRPEDILSVEFGGGAVSIQRPRRPAIHANHALHLHSALAQQAITESSHDRQARGEGLLAQGVRDPLAILRDTGGPGLPIRRDAPDDPDHENTLATAVFRIGQDGTEWSVHDRITDQPAYSGLLAPA